MPTSLSFPPEILGLILDTFRDCKSQDELIRLWTTMRFVCRQFKAAIEDMFKSEHLPKTTIYVDRRKFSLFHLSEHVHLPKLLRDSIYLSSAALTFAAFLSSEEPLGNTELFGPYPSGEVRDHD